MSIDTIVYENKNGINRIALLEKGRLSEFEQFSDSGVCEGNIYLGKIIGKAETAHGHTGFFVDINDTRPAFLNANEYGHEANLTEGQSVVVQVQQEAHAEKGAKVVRSIQFVGQNICYCPFKMGVFASSRIDNKALAEEYKLSYYDASYLELARRKGILLKTYDTKLKAAFSRLVKK